MQSVVGNAQVTDSKKPHDRIQNMTAKKCKNLYNNDKKNYIFYFDSFKAT